MERKHPLPKTTHTKKKRKKKAGTDQKVCGRWKRRVETNKYDQVKIKPVPLTLLYYNQAWRDSNNEGKKHFAFKVLMCVNLRLFLFQK